MVAAPQSEAAHEGAAVLRAGGTAADALVAAALVQGVVDPHRCGLGGFGCATVYDAAAGALFSVDFHGRAGSRCRPDQWEALFEGAAPDGFGYVLRGKVNDVGYASLTVPGMVAGLGEIHRRLGRLPWSELVLRAVPYAEEGFLVPQDIAEFWIRPGLYGRVSTRERLGHTETGRRICLKEDGETYRAGEVFRQPVLAETYRWLAREGPESFYRGAIARRIAEDWEQNGALVTAEDLAGYRARVGPPLRGSYRGFEVWTSGLPGGGVALLQALRLLERLDLASLVHNAPDYADAVAPVLSAVWTDRLAHHGDPDFGGPGAEELLSDAYIQGLAGAPAPGGAESEDTTQLSIVDADGNCISFSHSLGYGSGVFTAGLGFMYNNCMSAFDPRPGRRNSIEPGKRRTTAVAETILVADGRPVLVLGSPGAARITAAIVQTIVNVVDFGMTAAEAVVCSRFDAYGGRNLVLDSRFPGPYVRELRRRGWNVLQSPKPFGVVGRVYAIQISGGPGGPMRLVGGVDPGEPGAAVRG